MKMVTNSIVESNKTTLKQNPSKGYWGLKFSLTCMEGFLDPSLQSNSCGFRELEGMFVCFPFFTIFIFLPFVFSRCLFLWQGFSVSFFRVHSFFFLGGGAGKGRELRISLHHLLICDPG